MKHRLPLILAVILVSMAAFAGTDYTVTVAYNGTTATVSIPSEITNYVTLESGTSSHVKITQSSTSEDTPGEILYVLSGSSDDGEFYFTGEYKATIQMNGLTLNNPDSTAVHIKDGKRIKVSLVSGTENTLSDGTTDTESKGCFHCKGHTEFVGKGTLNVSSKIRHAIYSKEYVSIKNCTINVTGAVKDGIHCQEYFLMSSGTLNISDVEDDGIQVELKDSVSTGVTDSHEDEDSGNFYMTDGTITMNDVAAYCIKTDGSVTISGGTCNFDTSNIEQYATGISSISIDTTGNNGEAYYDLSGRKMTGTLPRGVYILRSNGQTKKVLVK